MPSRILTLTVASLICGVAFGQSKFDSGLSGSVAGVKVGMYGTADVGYVYASGGSGFTQAVSGATTPVDLTPGVSSTRTFSGLVNGIWKNSRLGINAEDDLGNGYKAIALMEFAVTVPQATGLASTRQSYVGLVTPVGVLTAGKLYVASTDAVVRNSAVEAITCSPITTLGRTLISSKTINNGTQVLTTMVTGAAAWWNNSVGFQTKDWSGFSFRAYYSFGETGEMGSTTGLTYAGNGTDTLPASANSATANTVDNERVSAGANYHKGAFNLDLVYQGQLKIRTTYPNTGSAANKLEGGSINEWYLGGNYDFGFMKIMGTYQTTASNLSTATVGRIGEKLWSGGVIVPVSKDGKLRLEYAHVAYNQDAMAQVVPLLQKNGGSGSWGFAYTNQLSRRTTGYVVITRTNNDMNSIDNDVNGTGVNVRGASNTMYALGLSYGF